MLFIKSLIVDHSSFIQQQKCHSCFDNRFRTIQKSNADKVCAQIELGIDKVEANFIARICEYFQRSNWNQRLKQKRGRSRKKKFLTKNAVRFVCCCCYFFCCFIVHIYGFWSSSWNGSFTYIHTQCNSATLNFRTLKSMHLFNIIL